MYSVEWMIVAYNVNIEMKKDGIVSLFLEQFF
jgi:hypothetical protein